MFKVIARYVVGLIIIAVCIGLALTYVQNIGHGKEVNIVKAMRGCLAESMPGAHGEEQIGHAHRICWMRAQKG